MKQVLLGLGSNIDRYHYLTSGLDALADRFGELSVSSVYESDAVGFRGDPFFNLVVSITTDMLLSELAMSLKQIELQNDRPAVSEKWSSRTLDIDILTYGDCVGVFEGITLPRDEVDKFAFVLKPLSELCPDQLHPSRKQTYAALWKQYNLPQANTLKKVDFIWKNVVISRA